MKLILGITTWVVKIFTKYQLFVHCSASSRAWTIFEIITTVCLQQALSPSAMNWNFPGFDLSENFSNHFNKIFKLWIHYCLVRSSIFHMNIKYYNLQNNRLLTFQQQIKYYWLIRWTIMGLILNLAINFSYSYSPKNSRPIAVRILYCSSTFFWC